MESSELQALLAELRQTQDGPTQAPARVEPSQQQQLRPASPSQLDSILSSLLPPPTPNHPTSHPPSDPTLALPTHSQLQALLFSLSAPAHPSPPPASSPPQPPAQRDRDLSALSFPEALPILQRLAMNDSFIGKLSAVRNEQDALEAELADERAAKEAEIRRTIGR